MKKKKRKSTALWIPRLKEAIRKRKIWVRQTEHTWLHKNGDGHKHYEIAIGADVFAIDEKYRQGRPWGRPQYVPNTWRVSVTDDGKNLMYTFLNEEMKNANVKFTADGERWFQETIGQIIAMYRMGAYRSAADGAHDGKGMQGVY